MRFLFILTACLGLIPFSTHAEAPAVTVVVGPEAPKLERYAADELSAQFQQLFDAEVTIADSQPGDAKNVILLGSPATNPAINADHWPTELSDQGHILKNIREGDDGAEQLIVGGGSPVATLWAVYELGHHFGMRYLLHGDFAPIDKPEFSLAKLDITLEPNLEVRAWRTIDSGAAGQESWGLADHEKLIRQLAKLKFNHITLVIHPWQPVYDVVRRIPRGKTATYGQVAALSGMPGAARQIGWALAALADNDDVPWQRVINARGEISARGEREVEDLQRALLQSEGIQFDEAGRVDLETYGWQPRGGRVPKKARRATKKKTAVQPGRRASAEGRER